jgi:putative N6-adenine-specific DNA methylase
LEPNLIFGSDMSEHSVNAVKTNIMGLHFGKEITITQRDFQEIDCLENHVIITNPPYGIRMGRDQNLNKLYHDFGLFLKTKCPKSTAFVYFGEPRYIKKVPLSPTWKRPLKIGGLDGKLVKYDLY